MYVVAIIQEALEYAKDPCTKGLLDPQSKYKVKTTCRGIITNRACAAFADAIGILEHTLIPASVLVWYI